MAFRLKRMKFHHPQISALIEFVMLVSRHGVLSPTKQALGLGRGSTCVGL